jgi:hypothetical protein
MLLKPAGRAVWFVVNKLHGVRLFVFIHFLARASQTCYAVQSDSEPLVQSLAYGQFLPEEFIVALLR